MGLVRFVLCVVCVALMAPTVDAQGILSRIATQRASCGKATPVRNVVNVVRSMRVRAACGGTTSAASCSGQSVQASCSGSQSVPNVSPPTASVASHPHYVSTTAPAQAWAEQEASRLAALGTTGYARVGGHPGGNNPHASFTGTGYGSGGDVPTCAPSGPAALVADAVRCVGGVCFRVRSWQ